MARPNKDNGKSNEVQISVEDVLRLRDSLVTGLATLQSAVIAHTNALLSGNSDSALDLLGLTKAFGNNVAGFQRAATPGLRLEGGETKRKRIKKPTDPNAPKRPLTAYFLYLHSARPIIAKDLGEKATPGDVSNEATRRWAAMSEEEKQLWSKAYQKNYAEYRDRVAAYKAKLQESDPSAAQLALENDAAADGEEDEEEEPAEGEVEEEVNVSPPPSLKSSKRRKTDKDAAASKNDTRPSVTKETPILPPSFQETEVPVPESSSKDRSRKRSERKPRGGDDGDKAKDESDQVKSRRSEDGEKEKRSDREKRSRRKRKSDVIEEE